MILRSALPPRPHRRGDEGLFEQPHFYYSFAHTPTDTARQAWLHVHSVGWAACRSDYDIERRAFFDYQLLCVIRGSGRVTVGQQGWEATSGTIVFLDLAHPYEISSNKLDPWEFIWIHFGGIGAQQFSQCLRADRNPVMSSAGNGQGASGLSRLFQKVFDLFRQPHTMKISVDATAHALLTQILCDLVVAAAEATVHSSPLPAASESPDAVKRGIEFIEQHYSEPLTLQAIAHYASLSPYHFAREFKRVTDYSVMGYLHEFRMMQAKRLLRESHYSIREIGERVGYPDQSYFSLRFRQHEQMTPSEYRTMHQGELGLPI